MFRLYYNVELPKKLDKHEEKKLIEKSDEYSKKILIERNLRLVKHVAKQFKSSTENFEDLLSIGTIGLIKGVNTYNPQKNTSLSTYLSKCIYIEIIHHLKNYNKRSKDVSINQVMPSNKGLESNLSIGDTLCEEHTPRIIENIENRYTLEKAIEKLNDKERRIIKLRYNFETSEKLTQSNVATIMNTSKANVSKIERNALAKLKEILA